MVCLQRQLDGISFAQHEDLDIQKEKELDSFFVDMQNAKYQNSIVSVVYRHPTMDKNEFIDLDIAASLWRKKVFV